MLGVKHPCLHEWRKYISMDVCWEQSILVCMSGGNVFPWMSFRVALPLKAVLEQSFPLPF